MERVFGAMSLYDVAAILIGLSALFGYINHKLIRLPATIGLVLMAMAASLGVVGLEMGARYDVNADWGIEGGVTYDRLIGDAGDSPITAVGNRDQFSFKLGVVRKFRIDF